MQQPPRGQLLIDSSDEEHVVATFNPILIAAFTRIPHERELAQIRARVDQAISVGVEGGLLYVVARRDMSGGVDPRVRAVFEDMIRQNQGSAGRTAVVVLTTGFAAAAIRGALAGLLAIFERRNALRVFRTVDEACAWLGPHHEVYVRSLRQAFEQATAGITTGALARPSTRG